MSKTFTKKNLPFLTKNTEVVLYPSSPEQLGAAIKETVNKFVFEFKEPLRYLYEAETRKFFPRERMETALLK